MRPTQASVSTGAFSFPQKLIAPRRDAGALLGLDGSVVGHVENSGPLYRLLGFLHLQLHPSHDCRDGVCCVGSERRFHGFKDFSLIGRQWCLT